MSAPHVLAEVKDGIGWLTLNRPESLNALSFEMTDLLITHTAEFEKDPKGRCVVIRGAGTHFMAGGDIKGFHKSLTENKAQHLAGFEMRKALEIALLGDRFKAQEAKDNHILNWIVPKEQLAAETEKMVRKLADGPTFALGVAKRLIRSSFDNSWDEHSHREAEGLAACATTEDHPEGLNAFLEERPPAFKGR